MDNLQISARDYQLSSLLPRLFYILDFQLTHNLYWTNLSSCYPLAIPLLSPYYPLTIDLLHFTITYPSPNLAYPTYR